MHDIAGHQSSNHIEEPQGDHYLPPIAPAVGVAVDAAVPLPKSVRHVATPAVKTATSWQVVVWKLMPDATVGWALNSARERLDEAGCSTARLDAQVILAHVLDVNRSWLFAHHDYRLNPEQAEAFTNLIVRRMAHEPVAYLVGRREFYGLEFLVDQRVLIPLPKPSYWLMQCSIMRPIWTRTCCCR
ncbi:MAG: hypothetical protein R2867_26325 [Caldilineaceae bacterium]